MGSPDRGLTNPGKVNPEEGAIMQTHTTIGGDTLKKAENRMRSRKRTFLSVARVIAYCHHEKWDGTGYPDGVAGEAIPLSARIVALADAYDGMASKRCYKEAFTHAKTRDIIISEKGRHFASDVVDAFLAREAEFDKIRAQLAGPAPTE